MTTVLYILLGVVAFVALVVIIARRWSVPCQVWLRWLVELDNPFSKTNRAATIVERLHLRPSMAVLDVGCGPGRPAVPIAQQVGQHGYVVAMDIQPDMLRPRAADLTNIRFLEAGAGDGKLGRDQFDRALLVTVLGEIPKPQAALREIFNALKPGGVLSVTEIIFDPHFQTQNTVRRLAEAVGFREQAFHGNRVAFTLNFAKPDVAVLNSGA